MSLENSAHSHICLQWCKTSPVSLHPTAGTAEGPSSLEVCKCRLHVDAGFCFWERDLSGGAQEVPQRIEEAGKTQPGIQLDIQVFLGMRPDCSWIK